MFSLTLVTLVHFVLRSAIPPTPVPSVRPIVSMNYVRPESEQITGLVLLEDGSLGRVWAGDDVRCELVGGKNVERVRQILRSDGFKKAFRSAERRASQMREPAKSPLLTIRFSNRLGVEPADKPSDPIKELAESLNALYRDSCTGSILPEIPIRK